jgi:hypothetical protein
MFGVLYLRKVTYHEHEAKRGSKLISVRRLEMGREECRGTQMAERCHPHTEFDFLKLAVL